jgi:hypothetical protein
MKKRACDAAQPIPTLMDRLRAMEIDSFSDLRALMLSQNFRSCESVLDQIQRFRECDTRLTFDQLACIFDIAKSTIWSWLREPDRPTESDGHADEIEPATAAPRAYLTPVQEGVLLWWIRKRQEQSDCPTPKHVREQAAEYYRLWTGEEKVFEKTWWKSFKKRHADKLAVEQKTATEKARCEVKKEDVEAYFAELRHALAMIIDNNQILNMDETGICARPTKGKKRKIVYCKDCKTNPTWTEDTQSDHVSLVSTITLGGKLLTPMYLHRCYVNPYHPELVKIWPQPVFAQTPKGYQTAQSMFVYVTEVIAPYVQELRMRYRNNKLPVWLIMDNCGPHRTEILMQAYKDLKLNIIWLPPHSSHFLQPLDLGFFADFKGKYQNVPWPDVKPRTVAKILRIDKAQYQAAYQPNLVQCWHVAGVWVTVWGKPPYKPGRGVDNERAAQIIERNCAQEPDGGVLTTNG